MDALTCPSISDRFFTNLVGLQLGESCYTTGPMVMISPYAQEHQSGIVSLIVPIQRAEFGIPITLEDQPDLLDIASFYQRGAGNFWVALQAEQVVGTIALLDIGLQQVALRKMFVHLEHRGSPHRVAANLFDTCLDWCVGQGVRAIYLGTTASFLAAHRFYEKHGFEEISGAQLPPSFPVMLVDTKFYRRELNPA